MRLTVPSFQVTKEELLSKVTEEQLFCYYLGMTSIPKKMFRNPLRVDRHDTCSFFRTDRGLRFKDFAYDETYDPFKVVMKKYGCSFSKALSIMASDFGVCPTSRPKVTPKEIPAFTKNRITKIGVQIRDFTPKDLEYWKAYGITKETLDKFQVYSCKAVFLNDSVFAVNESNLIFGYFGGLKKGLEKWRIYFPENKGTTCMRFLGNWDKTMIQGWKQLPENGKIVVITKSMKDVMCLHELDIPAIACCSENEFVSDEVLSELKERFKYVIVNYDSDLPGMAAMKRIRKKHPELVYTWTPRKEAKDFTDYYKTKGKASAKRLVAQLLRSLRDKYSKTSEHNGEKQPEETSHVGEQKQTREKIQG